MKKEIFLLYVDNLAIKTFRLYIYVVCLQYVDYIFIIHIGNLGVLSNLALLI